MSPRAGDWIETALYDDMYEGYHVPSCGGLDRNIEVVEAVDVIQMSPRAGDWIET